MTRLLCISDIHGDYEGFETVLTRANYNPTTDKLFLLGDYVDRGPQSFEVVKKVMELVEHGAVAMLGNHDDMFCHRDLDPRHHDQNGGITTLASYSKVPYEEKQRHIHFLRNLPLYHFYDKYLFVHAGINPSRPMTKQTRHELLWICEDWLDNPSPLGNEVKVVFGHTSSSYFTGKDEVYFGTDRIAINTNAWDDGYLSLVDLTNMVGYRSEK
jgi:serine/threonine protein phosphatase 1